MTNCQHFQVCSVLGVLATEQIRAAAAPAGERARGDALCACAAREVGLLKLGSGFCLLCCLMLVAFYEKPFLFTRKLGRVEDATSQEIN